MIKKLQFLLILVISLAILQVNGRKKCKPNEFFVRGKCKPLNSTASSDGSAFIRARECYVKGYILIGSMCVPAQPAKLDKGILIPA